MSFKIRSYNLKLSAAVFLIIVAFVQIFISAYHYNFPVNLVVTDTFCSIFLLYLILVFLPLNFNYYLPAIIRYAGIIIQSALIAVAWLFICKSILFSFFTEDVPYKYFWEQSLIFRMFTAWILIFDFYILKYFISEIKTEQKSIYKEHEILQLHKDGELFKLRQQLQPHFLFNSLNSINALIGQNPPEARKMVQQLSDYLRKNLKKEDRETVLFHEEYADLKLYLSIEEIRFGNRLLLKEEVNEECNDKAIPPFLLQPLVENAIKHGLYGTTGQVIIEIGASIQQSKKASVLIFSITNPFDPSSENADGTGFGLNSIQKRLYLLFLRNDLLETGLKEEENRSIFKATLKIPIN